MDKDRQMQVWIRKQQQVIRNAKTQQDKAVAIGMYAGYLNGLKLSNVITKQQYDQYYDQLMEFIENVAVA